MINLNSNFEAIHAMYCSAENRSIGTSINTYSSHNTTRMQLPMHKTTNSAQTFGFPNQFEGLKVAKRLSKSPLSHGLHERPDDPRADPPELVLREAALETFP